MASHYLRALLNYTRRVPQISVSRVFANSEQKTFASSKLRFSSSRNLSSQTNQSNMEKYIADFEGGFISKTENNWKEYLRALILTGKIDSVNMANVVRSFQTENNNLQQAVVQQAGTSKNPIIVSLSNTSSFGHIKDLAKFILISALGFLVLKAVMQEGLNSAMDSNYIPTTNQNTRFDDIVGCEPAKQELQEIVSYLKNPSRMISMGIKLPKGVLLVGPAGTGKTQLAKAVSAEAGVPFYYASGSEFDEMYVGVGAKRVRQLFAAAKKNAPSVIFIDEIDAVGEKRGGRDNNAMRMTLNQLLTELDGFHPTESVVVLAATNFEAILDPALVRSGRFDRRVTIDLPDSAARKKIIDLYLSKIPHDENIDTGIIARGLPGASGADLENMVNMAAIKATNENASLVDMSHIDYARDKIILGTERTTIMTPEVLNRTAYHEGGHAVVSLFIEGCSPIYKATIVPRGQTLGVVHYIPENDILNDTRKSILGDITIAMGGRVAEELIFGEDNVSTGAASDLVAATRLARTFVIKVGMSRNVGFISVQSEQDWNELSPSLRKEIDNEVRRILEECYERAKNLLKTHRKELELMRTALLELETLTGDEVRDVVLHKKSISYIRSQRETKKTQLQGKSGST